MWWILLLISFVFGNTCVCDNFTDCQNYLSNLTCTNVSLNRSINVTDVWGTLNIPSNKIFDCGDKVLDTRYFPLFVIQNAENVTINRCDIRYRQTPYNYLDGYISYAILINDSKNITVIANISANPGSIVNLIEANNVSYLYSTVLDGTYVSRLIVSNSKNLLFNGTKGGLSYIFS